MNNSKATRNTLLERDIIPEEFDKQEDLRLIEQRKEKLLKSKEAKKLDF